MPSHYNQPPAGGPMPGPMPQGGPMPGPMPGPAPMAPQEDRPIHQNNEHVAQIFAKNGGDAFAVRDPSQSEAVQRTSQELGMPPEVIIEAVEQSLSDNFEKREGGGLHGLEVENARNGAANKLLAQQNPQPYGPPRRGS